MRNHLQPLPFKIAPTRLFLSKPHYLMPAKFSGNRERFLLTRQPFMTIFSPLLLPAHLEGGFCTPFSLGHKRPHSLAVFLCPSKIKTVSCRLNSMVGCIGQSLWLAAPKRGSAKPDTVRHPKICTFAWRLHHQSLGVTA